jgi:lipopolysaccharide/colanic/teichoic acid biosynthesis glycosyltransferase
MADPAAFQVPVRVGPEIGSRAKRVLDVALVLAAAPAWVPLLAVVAAATAIASGRPVFFSQVRMGLGGRPLRIVKVRTMRADIPAPDGVLFAGWTYPGDPRVTPLGRWLRRRRLDELPQLWSVLRGDMSIVGPRPEPWEVAVELGERIPGYHERHRVRPGLTGLCQVSRVYRDLGTVAKSARKARLDLRYVRRRSLWLDLRILLRTVRVLFRGEGIA